MDSESLKECKTLENEITTGRDQVKRFEASSSGNEERLLESMLASYEEALSILHGITSEGQGQSILSSSSDTPGSAMSLSNLQFEDSKNVSNPSQDNRSQKRVIVTSKVTAEGLDDGYVWRKYGRKQILGSKFPRAYYRCARKGCLATKQVQRSENDPLTFEVTYYGKHTCISPAPVDPPHGITLEPSKMDSCKDN